MKNTFKKYVWLFEWIAAALIIAVGVVVGFVDGVVLVATGIALILIALLRVIPLFKTTKDKVMKWINAIEIIANVCVGAVLIYIAINAWNNGSEIQLGKIFSYLLGAILYARGIIFFIGTSLRGEPTDIAKFCANLVFLSLGLWFVSRPYDEKVMGYFVLAIAILCSLYVIFDGYKNYRKYRYEYAAEIELKKVQKKAKKEMELPKGDSKTDEVNEPNIDNVPLNDEPSKSDDAVEEPTNQPNA